MGVRSSEGMWGEYQCDAEPGARCNISEDNILVKNIFSSYNWFPNSSSTNKQTKQKFWRSTVEIIDHVISPESCD